jgi:hypothetical protein
VRIQTGVAGGSDEVFAFFVRDVGLRFAVAVAFGEAVVDDADGMAGVSPSDGEVVGLDVAMKDSVAVKGLDAGELLCYLQLTISQANERTVGRLSFILQQWKRSSMLGPNNSNTITLYSPSSPPQ